MWWLIVACGMVVYLAAASGMGWLLGRRGEQYPTPERKP